MRSFPVLLTLLGASIGARFYFQDEAPPGPERYLGREIATTMHWTGAEWLLRKTREEQENVTLLLEALDVQPGWTIADVGVGNGYHALPMAREVGPEGRVLGVDIQPEMLRMLEQRARDAGIENVVAVLGGATDPNLEPGSCDLILMVDVYHEISQPAEMLASLRRSLRPGGRVALVEFRGEDPDVPIKPLHKMTKVQCRKEFEANGFVLTHSFDELPWQHLLFFARSDLGPEDGTLVGDRAYAGNALNAVWSDERNHEVLADARFELRELRYQSGYRVVPLALYGPREQAAAARPCVVLQGAGLVNDPALFHALAEAGYIVVAPVGSEAGSEAREAARDLHALVPLLRSLRVVDERNLYLLGEEGGGTTCLQVLFDGFPARAVVTRSAEELRPPGFLRASWLGQVGAEARGKESLERALAWFESARVR